MGTQVYIAASFETVRNRAEHVRFGWVKVPDDWRELSPADKVLAIHEHGRDLTQGKPFTVLSVRDRD